MDTYKILNIDSYTGHITVIFVLADGTTSTQTLGGKTISDEQTLTQELIDSLADWKKQNGFGEVPQKVQIDPKLTEYVDILSISSEEVLS